MSVPIALSQTCALPLQAAFNQGIVQKFQLLYRKPVLYHWIGMQIETPGWFEVPIALSQTCALPRHGGLKFRKPKAIGSNCSIANLCSTTSDSIVSLHPNMIQFQLLYRKPVLYHYAALEVVQPYLDGVPIALSQTCALPHSIDPTTLTDEERSNCSIANLCSTTTSVKSIPTILQIQFQLLYRKPVLYHIPHQSKGQIR